jgi:hypothetical protein
MRKRLVAVLVPILALSTAVPAALASGSPAGPSGRFRTTITHPASLKGTWTISFDGGRDSDYLNGKKVASGTYTRSGSTISFAQRTAPAGQKQCQTPGKYRFMLSGATLTFTKISDPCNPVRSELLSHRFSKL